MLIISNDFFKTNTMDWDNSYNDAIKTLESHSNKPQ